MKDSNKISIEKARDALEACLPRASFVRIEEMKQEANLDGIRVDLLMKAELPTGSWELAIQIKSNGQPRFAREAAELLRLVNERRPGTYGIFMAPFVSPRSGEICREAGVGFVDLAGNCLLTFWPVYIEKRTSKREPSRRRELRSLFSPKSSRVIRVLLSRPEKSWMVEQLAEEADVSVGQVSKVRRKLLDRELAEGGRGEFRLIEPEQVLEEWTEAYTFRNNQVRDFYCLKDARELEEDLARFCNEHGIRYALTGFSGAARIAPTVIYNRGMAYVEETDVDIAAELELKEVASGMNVTLLTPYDDGVFYGAREMDGAVVASPIQLYLDLKGYRGRGEEAARAILEGEIRDQW